MAAFKFSIFPVLPVPSLLLYLPSFEVVNGLLNTLLVVADHVLVHVGVVGANVLLCAAVWDRAKTQRRVLLRRLLELWQKKRKMKTSCLSATVF